jgi:hypothetical protein
MPPTRRRFTPNGPREGDGCAHGFTSYRAERQDGDSRRGRLGHGTEP